jgi:N-dimethylarginine dimethylaminohydrolase
MSTELFHYHRMSQIFGADRSAVFEEPNEQERVWGKVWGCDNDVGCLRSVLMHRPGPEWDIIDPAKPMAEFGGLGDLDVGWYWAGKTPPNLGAMQAQHDALAGHLKDEGVEVIEVTGRPTHLLKLCYMRDSVIALKGGAIVCRMAPKIRRGEEFPVTRTLAGLGMPILRTLHGDALMEGGSFAWINRQTAVVGLGERCNEAGARQIEDVLREQGVELLRVALTGYSLHIDGAFVMIDVDKALVDPTELPHWFLERLSALGVKAIPVGPEDHPFTVNALALAPGRIVMSHATPATRARLEKEDIDARILPYDAVCAGGGGIHCSTSPLRRDPVPE